MRLWHQSLIPHLDRQRLLGQHRELCALRGKGWRRKHATVDYVFTHEPDLLVAYHILVMEEMRHRGYYPDKNWYIADYRGKNLSLEQDWADQEIVEYLFDWATNKGGTLYPEHNEEYLNFCINLLKEKGAPIDYDKIY